MLRNKRGVDITLQTVIVAVIVIIVMIVLIVIFTKGTGGFLTSTGCSSRGGSCVGDAESCTSSGGSVYGMGKCDNGVCCIPDNSLIKDENAQP
jgi:ABC-type uncharacterized transport system permease subunit